MVRELTKSALSFSWALSLLGVKQVVSIGRPGQQNGNGDLFAPVTQMAVGQLDESMKGIYRSGDNLGSRAVDLAFCWLNPLNWLNPSSWTNVSNWANPSNWVNPSNWTRSVMNCAETSGGCGCSASGMPGAPGTQQASASGGPGPASSQDNPGGPCGWGPPRNWQ
jgi:hypothetical protein